MIGITFDYWPILLQVFPQELSDEDVEAMIRSYDEAYTRREKFIVMVDTMEMIRVPTSIQRKRLADYSADIDHKTNRYALGSGFVMKSTIGRNAMTALRWAYRTEKPDGFLANREEAAHWCLGHLDAAGVDAALACARLVRDSNAGLKIG